MPNIVATLNPMNVRMRTYLHENLSEPGRGRGSRCRQLGFGGLESSAQGRERGTGEQDRGLEGRGGDRRPLAYSTIA